MQVNPDIYGPDFHADPDNPSQAIKVAGRQPMSFEDMSPNISKSDERQPKSFEDMWPQSQETAAEPAKPADTTPYGVSEMADKFNMFAAGNQRTTPDVEAHRKNYVADMHAYGDDDSVSYLDKDGKDTPMDPKSQVALVDPKDGKIKIFARSDETDEKNPITSRLKALGSYFTNGFSTGSPGQLATAAAGRGISVLGIPLTKGLTAAGQAGGEGAGAAAEAGKRLGIDVPRAIASPSTAVQSQAVTLAKTPVVGTPLTESANKLGNQIENRVGQTAESLSPSGEVLAPADAGNKTRAGFKLWSDQEFGAGGNVAQKYDAVDHHINPKVKQTLNNTWDVVYELQKKYGAAALVDAQGVAKSPALKEILPTLNKPGGMDYDTLKFVRTRVGKMIDNPGEMAGGINEAELKQIYGGLTKDLEKLVNKAGGQKGVDAWNEANAYTKSINEKRRLLDDTLGNTSKSDEGLFGQVIKYAGSKDQANIKALANAKNILPAEHWQDLGASVINKLGLNKGGDFDPKTFSDAYKGLSDEGKNLLFGAKGSAHRQALDDIATISSKGKNIAKMSSSSMGHGIGITGSLAAFEALKEGHEILQQGIGLHHIGDAAAILGGLIGGRAYANFLSRPASAMAIARWMRTSENVHANPGQSSLAAFNNASKGLATYLEGDVKSGDPNAVTRYLQSAAKDIVNGQ